MSSVRKVVQIAQYLIQDCSSRPPSSLQVTLFGREVIGVDPGNLSPAEFAEIERLLYTKRQLSPEQQFAFTRDVRDIWTWQQQDIGERTVDPELTQGDSHAMYLSHEGFETVALKHPSHCTSHKTGISLEDKACGMRCFNHWHMDAALYELFVPKVMILYAVHVPQGPQQNHVRHNAPPAAEHRCACGVHYAPYPYIWMGPAATHSTGLAIKSEGKELPLDQLPPWMEDKIQELFIDPLPEDMSHEGVLYPDGAHLMDLEKEKNVVLFHDRGTPHSIMGVFKPDQHRAPQWGPRQRTWLGTSMREQRSSE
ncbi:Clavaminate synthase-like protein [Lactarius psammicola]|nr:Clavaminate synthase-like protein [Lactarius psammicola]